MLFNETIFFHFSTPTYVLHLNDFSRVQRMTIYLKKKNEQYSLKDVYRKNLEMFISSRTIQIK